MHRLIQKLNELIKITPPFHNPKGEAEMLAVIAEIQANDEATAELSEPPSVLIEAVENGFSGKIIDKLIEAGAADFKDHYTDAITPLMFAAKTNNLELAEKLIEAGVRLNPTFIRRDEGNCMLWITAYDFAEERCHYKMASFLRRAEVLQSHKQSSPRMYKQPSEGGDSLSKKATEEGPLSKEAIEGMRKFGL